MQRKLSEISSFEVILCLSVVMIHILSESVASYAKNTILSFLSFAASKSLAFVVPGFMISAGIKFAHKFEHGSFGYFSFLKGRITRIYLPYVLFSVIYYLYFVFYRKYFDFSFEALFNYLKYGSIAAPFYFVALIMQFYILSPLIMLFCRIIPSNLGIFIAAVINILSVYYLRDLRYGDRIFTSFILYWVIGCYMGMDFRTTMSRLLRSKKIWVISGIVLTIVYVGFSYLDFLEIYTSFVAELLKIAFCISASIMCLISMPKSVGFFAEEVAPVTFYIYLIHCLVIFETQHQMDLFGITSIPLRFLIAFLSAYIISLLVSVIYLKFKKLFTRKEDSYYL